MVFYAHVCSHLHALLRFLLELVRTSYIVFVVAKTKWWGCGWKCAD